MRKFVCYILLLSLTRVSFTHQFAGEVTEYEIKAAFLYNFGKFIEWPDDHKPNADEPFIIGILGQDPFGRILDRLAARNRLKDHKIELKRFKKTSDVRFCHILFISQSKQERLSDILEKVRTECTVTVSEIDDFVEKGGIIRLLTTPENKVRFEINNSAALDVGLKISSRLLRLAENLKIGPTNGQPQ